MADAKSGFSYIMDQLQVAGDKAMEIAGTALQVAATKTTEAIGGALAALASIIPGAGEMVKSATESLTAAMSAKSSETFRPTSSPAITTAPEVSAPAPNPQMFSGLANPSNFVTLSAAYEAYPGNLGTMTPPAFFTGKMQEFGGIGITQS